MPAGSAQLAKRALVTLLLILARKYDIPAVVVNRDSPDAACFPKLWLSADAWGRTFENYTALVQKFLQCPWNQGTPSTP